MRSPPPGEHRKGGADRTANGSSCQVWVHFGEEGDDKFSANSKQLADILAIAMERMRRASFRRSLEHRNEKADRQQQVGLGCALGNLRMGHLTAFASVSFGQQPS